MQTVFLHYHHYCPLLHTTSFLIYVEDPHVTALWPDLAPFSISLVWPETGAVSRDRENTTRQLLLLLLLLLTESPNPHKCLLSYQPFISFLNIPSPIAAYQAVRMQNSGFFSLPHFSFRTSRLIRHLLS